MASSPMTTAALPSSPAARAFFAALDGDNSASKNYGGYGDDGQQQRRLKKEKKTKKSAFIEKRIQTLGWRNRYSQDDYYPIEVMATASSSLAPAGGCNADADADADADSSPAKFRVLQVQRGELEGTYGTGATVWPASVVLIKYLERHRRRLVENKIVVDLGSGTGVTSIAAAALGARRVICTDGQPAVVELARRNARSAASELAATTSTATDNADGNKADPSVVDGEGPAPIRVRNCPVYVQEYWWGKGPTPLENNDCSPVVDGNSSGDLLVLVSDCVLPKLYPIAPLVDALDQLLPLPSLLPPPPVVPLASQQQQQQQPTTAGKAMAILSYEHRYYPEYDPRQKFQDLASDKGMKVRIVPLRDQDPVYSVDDIEIWEVTRDIKEK